MSESLVDTDILSFYFKGQIRIVESFKNYLLEFSQINISIITYYEILAGLMYKGSEKQISQFEAFCRINNIIHISESSAKISSQLYANLRNKGKTIGTSDLLIAGIALENKFTLVTNNEKHFKSIINLKVQNWSK